MKLLRLVKRDGLRLLSFPKIVWVILIYLWIGWITQLDLNKLAFYTKETVHAWDILVMAFKGPGIHDFVMADLFKWFIPQALLIYITGHLLDQELKGWSLYTIPRIGSFSMWIATKILALFVFTGAYFFIGFCTVLVLSLAGNPISSEWGSFLLLDYKTLGKIGVISLLIHQLTLLWLTGFAFALLQTLLTLLVNQSIYGVLGVIVFHLVSVNIGYFSLSSIKWLPTNQGIGFRHHLLEPKSDLTFLWSYSYLCIFSILLITCLFSLIRKKELLVFSRNL